MNKKEQSTWGVFFTSVALPLVFVGLLSFNFQGCGSDPVVEPKPRPEEICVVEDDFFQGPPGASHVLPAAKTGSSRKNLFVKDWGSAGLWNFVLKSTGGNLDSYLKPDHDSVIEQLEQKSPPKSLIDLYKRAVPLLVVVVDEEDSSQNDYIAVAGASIQEGVFRKANEEEETKCKEAGFEFSNLKNNPQEYKKHRLMEDYDFDSNGDRSPKPNGKIFFIEKFPTISLWYETEKERDLALKNGKYRTYELSSPLKTSELSNIDSMEKYIDEIEKKLKNLNLRATGGTFEKLGDVPPKEGSNLKALWRYSFSVGPTGKKMARLAGSVYLVKIHVG